MGVSTQGTGGTSTFHCEQTTRRSICKQWRGPGADAADTAAILRLLSSFFSECMTCLVSTQKQTQLQGMQGCYHIPCIALQAF